MSTKRRVVRGLYSPELLEDRIAPATLVVTTLADSGEGSLRQAILDANATPAADTIVFKTGPGTIVLTSGEMLITENLTIKGPGAGKITIDAGGASRIFNIDDGTDALKTASISGLNLVNGNVAGGNGGAILSRESLTLQKMVIAGNTATSSGGAIFVNNTDNTKSGTLTISNSTIMQNTASTGGGLYANSKGTVRITNTTISGNTATNSCGGLYIHIDSNGPGDIILKGVTLTRNTATNDTGGAGFDNDRDGGKILISNSTIQQNSASSAGGLYFDSGFATITNTIIALNTSTKNGAGIVDSGLESLTLNKSKVLFNRASDSDAQGGGLFANSSNVKVTGSQFVGNFAGDSGGGIAVINGTALTVLGSTFSGNSTGAGIGGGIAGYTGAKIKVSNSLFSENVAGDDGASIGVYGYNADAVTVDVSKTTFLRNYANNDAGGIRAYGDGTTKVTSSKFFDNVAANGGGALYADGDGVVNILNSIFARNRAGDRGGALYLATTGANTITNCVIMDNYSNDQGGGIHLGGGTLVLKSTKVTGNFAAISGGGIRNDTTTAIQLIATVITNNIAPTNPDKDGLFTP